ncbi:MAG: MFS transporter, partial [Firmicutes bacterium]|nr:MFS transporter [Bacillota bacterium]
PGPGPAFLIAVGIGIFISGVVSSGAGIAIPIVQQEFAAGVTAAQWVSLIYLATVGGLLLAFGRMSDLWGLRKVYLFGAIVTTAGSLLCGLATSIGWLIAYRAVQAAGMATLLATAPALLTLAYPPDQRGRALGFQMAVAYAGLTAGPSFGGLVAEWWSWRGIFLVNVPLGIALIIMAWRVVPHHPVRSRISSRVSSGVSTGDFSPESPGVPPRESFDLTGAILFMTAVFLGLAGATRAAPPSLALAGLGLAAAFILWEWRLERAKRPPMLSLSLFQRREFSVAATISVIGYTCDFFVAFLVPFYLLQVLGLPPVQAGLVYTVKYVLVVFAANPAGALSDRIGPRPLSLISMASFAVGFLLQSRLDAASGIVVVIAVLALSGLAAGIFDPANNSAMLGSAPKSMYGVASAFLAQARYIGMMAGTALSGVLLTLRPDSLLAGFQLAMGIGALIALAGFGVALFQRGCGGGVAVGLRHRREPGQ